MFLQEGDSMRYGGQVRVYTVEFSRLHHWVTSMISYGYQRSDSHIWFGKDFTLDALSDNSVFIRTWERQNETFLKGRKEEVWYRIQQYLTDLGDGDQSTSTNIISKIPTMTKQMEENLTVDQRDTECFMVTETLCMFSAK